MKKESEREREFFLKQIKKEKQRRRVRGKGNFLFKKNKEKWRGRVRGKENYKKLKKQRKTERESERGGNSFFYKIGRGK